MLTSAQASLRVSTVKKDRQTTREVVFSTRSRVRLTRYRNAAALLASLASTGGAGCLLTTDLSGLSIPDAGLKSFERDDGADASQSAQPLPDALSSLAAATVFQCGAERVSGCSECPEAGAVCFFCAHNVIVGSCRTSTLDCAAGPSPGSALCACTDPADASNCPGPTQVCVSGVCRMCGEPATNQARCAGGGGCDRTEATCSRR